MGIIINTIEKETSGESFNSYKYCYDSLSRGSIDYDDNKDIIWKNRGETEKITTPINLKNDADSKKGYPSIFSFFLDGSRRTFKVDDISYQKNVYPIIAGQIGVGCCERDKDKKTLKPALPFERNLAIVLPDKAFSCDWGGENEINNLKEKINENLYKKNKYNHGDKLNISKLMLYNTNKDEAFDKKGIAKIQEYMVELEKKMVSDLVCADKLNHEKYLIKDGSLDYQEIPKTKNKNALNLSDKHFKCKYQRVIGVSKSFDPTKCLTEGGGTNSNIIANLNLYERTPAYRYESKFAKVDFCIWYLRIRERKHTNNVFDGIIKIEKLIITDEEEREGINTDDINNLTAYLINERNPVCYGSDNRWANHLYPIYLTEQYVKSKYLSNNLFLKLF